MTCLLFSGVRSRAGHLAIVAALAAFGLAFLACGGGASSDDGAATADGGPPAVGPPGAQADGSAPAPGNEAGAPPRKPATIMTIAGKNSAQPGFADGDAKSTARFDAPEGLALDPTGNQLYVADSFNHAIRHLDLLTNKVTTVAGVGGKKGSNDTTTDAGGGFVPARLDTPRNLVFDPSGKSLYFTDTGNFVIRRLDLAGYKVTTVFGKAGFPGTADGSGGDARFGKMGQPWGGGMVIDAKTDPQHPILYVADSANQTIRAIDLTTREVKTIVGQAGVAGFADGTGLEAKLNKPAGVALDGAGNLYVVEANNLGIRRIDLTTKKVVLVAGKAPANPNQFCENVSPVIPPECGWVDASKGTDARFRFPFGVAPDEKGGMFMLDSHNNVVRHFDMRTTAVTTVAGVQREVLDDIPHESHDTTADEPGTFWHPSHVAFKGPNVLFVADRSANCIRRVELGANY